MEIKEPMKSKLVAALRSNQYEQISGALREDDETTNTSAFCCLGVLCDLHDNTRWDGELYAEDGLLLADTLPYPIVLQYLEDSDSIGSFNGDQSDQAKAMFGKEFSNLAAMNDNGLSFHEIADFIEKHC